MRRKTFDILASLGGNATLKAEVQTVFQGTTLRGLLLEADAEILAHSPEPAPAA